jgi:hypothetical protein
MSYSFVCSDPEIMATAKETKKDDDIPDIVRQKMKEARFNLLREERDNLLKTTDKYITMSDMPNMTQEKMETLKVYRQQLREYMNNLDVDSLTGFSCDVIPPFPEKPFDIK